MIIEIKNCSECLFRYTSCNEEYLKNPNLPQARKEEKCEITNRIIPDIKEIPEWCVLRAMEKQSNLSGD